MLSFESTLGCYVLSAQRSTFTELRFFDRIGGMGRAGKALKSVLDQHKISQNRLAVLLQVDRSVVFKWFHEQRDPTAETVVEIVTALQELNPEAARDFVQCYLGELLE